MNFLSPKILFTCIWLPIFGATLYYISRSDEGNEAKNDGRAIAVVETKTGEVEYRPRDVLLWSNAKTKGKLFEGDFIATGVNGKSEIKLNDGHTLHLGENSQIIISGVSNKLKGKSDSGYIVTLLTGSLHVATDTKGKAARNAASALKINSGEKQFTLKDKADEVALLKEASAPAVVKAVTGNVTVAQIQAPVKNVSVPSPTPTAAQPKLAAVPIPTPTPINAEGFSARLGLKQSSIVFWARADIGQALNIDIPVMPPPLPPAQDIKWSAFIDANLSQGGKTITKRVTGSTDFKRQVMHITIPRSEIPAGSKTHSTLGDELQMDVHAGSILSRGSMRAETVSPDSAKIVFRFLKNLNDIPINVYLQGYSSQATPSSSKFLLADESLPSRSGVNVLQLTHGRDVEKIVDIISRAESIYIAPANGSNMNQKAGYVVRENQVIAGISGPNNAALAVEVMAKIVGRLSYVGSREAFVYAPTPKHKFSSVFKNMSSRPSNFYVVNGFRGDHFFAISDRLLGQSEDALNYLDDSANAIFNEPVRMLAIQNTDEMTSSNGRLILLLSCAFQLIWFVVLRYARR